MARMMHLTARGVPSGSRDDPVWRYPKVHYGTGKGRTLCGISDGAMFEAKPDVDCRRCLIASAP